MRKEINPANIEQVYTLAKKHYENFPVVSFLLPKEMRKHVAAIYWFARTADDIADEFVADENEKIRMLEAFEKDFLDSLEGKSVNQFHKLVATAIYEKNLTAKRFTDLLSAFKQDVTKKRYSSIDEILDYCSRSANPVGRLMLELTDNRNAAAIQYSDKICTALQLTNFYQDFSRDIEINRIYIPLDEMRSFRVSEEDILNKRITAELRALVKFQVDRAQKFFDEGKNLFNYLEGRFKLEIKWTVAGGEKILEDIRKLEYNSFENRPHLSKFDFLQLFIKTLFNG